MKFVVGGGEEEECALNEKAVANGREKGGINIKFSCCCETDSSVCESRV